MRRKIFVLLIAAGLLIGIRAIPVSAYDDATTHPALTDEVVNFYNLSSGSAITPEEKEWIVQGSILEDTPPRWINHFYDPVHKIGWTGEKMGSTPAAVVQAFSAIGLSAEGAVSAVDWVNDYALQERYSRYGGNRTWKRALEYYAEGNKEEAYKTLGHILHLLEDMSVPDHTRNDTHPHLSDTIQGDPSPFEGYLTKYTRNNMENELHIVAKLKAGNLAPVQKNSIQDYLVSLAEYSNKYFFSKDSINDMGFSSPKIVREDESFGYGRDENGQEFPLAKVWVSKTDQPKFTRGYIIEQSDQKILDAYFSHLSRQAVLHGAGVIQLFQRQAADAVENKNYAIHLEKFNFPTIPMISPFGELARANRTTVGSFLGQIVSSVSDLYGKAKSVLAGAFSNAFGTNAAPEAIEIPLDNSAQKQSVPGLSDPGRSTQVDNSVAQENNAREAPLLPSAINNLLPALQDGTAPKLPALGNPPAAKGAQEPKAATQASAPAPSAKSCSFSASAGQVMYRKVRINEIAWMGTNASANDEWVELKNITSAPIDISGWQLLDQGEQIKIVFAAGTTIAPDGYLLLERTDDNAVPTVAADAIYNGALSNTNEGLRLFDAHCTIVDEVFANPEWPAGESATRLTMERDAGGVGWHTTTVSGGTPRRENSQPTSSAVAIGGGGGVSAAPSSQSAVTPPAAPAPSSPPVASGGIVPATHVVISEIQAGTDASAGDEFIELYNPTNQPINLSGWELRKRTSSGSESNLVDNGSFTGTILAKGFFLIASSFYAGSVTPDLRSATSTSIAYANNTIVLYRGDHAGAPIEDAVTYASIDAGKSLERKAVAGGQCVSAQDGGEYLGNACDTDTAADFDLRATPKPQNSQSLPEPRATVQIQNPSVSYSSTTMELVFHWGSSADAAGATSTVAYEVQEYNSPSVVISHATGTREFRKSIDEVGRTYHFSLQTFDVEGLASATSSLDIVVPSFLNHAVLYENATSTYRLDLAYPRYPFIPDHRSWSGPSWKILVAYLNQDASKVPSGLATMTGLALDASTTPLSFVYRTCANGEAPRPLLILPDDASRCSVGGGVDNSALSFDKLEDPHLVLDVVSPAQPFGTNDYLTFAYYAFGGGGGGSQGFSLVAVDKTKYFFSVSPPTSKPPTPPKDPAVISVTHDESTGASALLLSFGPSRDPDSLDSGLRYERSTDGSTWQTLGLTGGPDPAKKYGALSLPMGGAYAISLRSVDETALISPVATASAVTLPPLPACPKSTGNAYYAIDCIRLEDGLVKIRWRLLSNPAGGATFGIAPYLAERNPSAGDALYKDINGNQYSGTTATSSGQCSSSIMPFREYELGRQYQRNFSAISGVPASDLTATTTIKFAIFVGTCSPGELSWNDSQKYAISAP